MDINAQLFDFIEKSPSPFHAVDTVCRMLDQAGFVRLQEGRAWQLQPQGKYYVTRNRSSVVAFAMPAGEWGGFLLTSSHSDCPTFKVKPGAELEAAGLYTMLDTEGYGGMLCSTWLDRPLGVVGRVLVETDQGVETRLVTLDPLRLVIPNLAIHMDRQANDGKKYSKQTDMLPLLGDAGAKGSFDRLVAQAAGAEPGQVLGSELYLYNPQPGQKVGAEGEYICCPRLDDLECAFGTLQGFVQAQPGCNVNVYAMLDNEEVGSGTKQGADSNFLASVLERVCLCSGRDRQGYFAALAASMMISADNAHAVHPGYPGKSDPVTRTRMNGGVVIKSNANQAYTTDAVSAALVKSIAAKAGAPVQYFVNHSDVRGGSTLGNISSTQAAISTVDVGLPQLAMHSCCETAGSKDLEALVDLCRGFYSSSLTLQQDGSWSL